MFYLAQATHLAFRHLDYIQVVADDVIGCSKQDTDPIWVRLRLFFQACVDVGFCIKPSKLVLVARSCHWCGHDIDAKGATIHPKNVEAVLQLPRPRNGAQLIKIIGAAGFIGRSIPNLARVILPLRTLHTEAVKKVGAKSHQLQAYQITPTKWTKELDESFRALKELIVNRTKLAHRDPNLKLVVMTDASSTGWAAAVFQVSPSVLEQKPIQEIDCLQPLAFCGGTWNGPEKFYPTIEQEGLAIILTFRRLFWLLDDGSEILLLSDNKNLIYIFDPDSPYVRDKPSPGYGRLVRWAEEINHHRYVIQHIPGEVNHFADILSRAMITWKKSLDDDSTEEDEEAHMVPALSSRISMSSLQVIPSPEHVDLWHGLFNSSSEDFVQPSLGMIHEIAGDFPDSSPAYAEMARSCDALFDYTDRVYKIKSGQVLIPDDEVLRVSLMVMAHAAGAAHRGIKTTHTLLRSVVFWPNMGKDIDKFVGGCVHCKVSKATSIPRPYGETVEAQARREVLSMDYVFMGQDYSMRYEKILVLTDKLSGYTVFVCVKSENVPEAIDALLDWFARYGIPKMLMTDQGSAFISGVLSGLKNRLGVDHHLTAADTPWSHGRQERLNLVIGNGIRALLSENLLSVTHWPLVAPLVMMAINHTPTQVLANHAPISIFCGLAPSNPMHAFLDVESQTWKELPNGWNQIEEMVTAVHKEIHEREIQVSDLRIKLSTHTRDARMNKRGVQPIQFDVGDYVMVLVKEGRKLDPRLIGPARIVRQTDSKHKWLFDVEYLIPRAKPVVTVHVSRIFPFDLAGMTVTPAVLEHADYLSQSHYVIDQLLEIRQRTNAWEVKVRWAGFQDLDDTWEPLSVIFKDAPGVVKHFLTDGTRHRLAPARLTQVKRMLKIL
jgi:hypothetical protein